MNLDNRFKKIAVIVAHPDDETLWCGGLILMNPDREWTIYSMCRGDDPDRSPKFSNVLKYLNAKGNMSTLDDGPEQFPLDISDIKKTILSILLSQEFDLIITHSLNGEYTSHKRHEEISTAVSGLWQEGLLKGKELWMFAYEDDNKRYLPKAIASAHLKIKLPRNIWEKKYQIITDIYNFPPDGFEGQTSPREEGFWCFKNCREISDMPLFKHIFLKKT